MSFCGRELLIAATLIAYLAVQLGPGREAVHRQGQVGGETTAEKSAPLLGNLQKAQEEDKPIRLSGMARQKRGIPVLVVQSVELEVANISLWPYDLLDKEVAGEFEVSPQRTSEHQPKEKKADKKEQDKSAAVPMRVGHRLHFTKAMPDLVNDKDMIRRSKLIVTKEKNLRELKDDRLLTSSDPSEVGEGTRVKIVGKIETMKFCAGTIIGVNDDSAGTVVYFVGNERWPELGKAQETLVFIGTLRRLKSLGLGQAKFDKLRPGVPDTAWALVDLEWRRQ